MLQDGTDLGRIGRQRVEDRIGGLDDGGCHEGRELAGILLEQETDEGQFIGGLAGDLRAGIGGGETKIRQHLLVLGDPCGSHVEQRNERRPDPLAEEIDGETGLGRAILHPGKLVGDGPEGIDGQDLAGPEADILQDAGKRPRTFRQLLRLAGTSAGSGPIAVEPADDPDCAAGRLIQRIIEAAARGHGPVRPGLKFAQRFTDADEATVQRAGFNPCDRCRGLQGLQLCCRDAEARGEITQFIGPVQGTREQPRRGIGGTRGGGGEQRDAARGVGKRRADVTQSSRQAGEARGNTGARRTEIGKGRAKPRELGRKIVAECHTAEGLLEPPGRALALLAEAPQLAENLFAAFQPDRLADHIAAACHQSLRMFSA